MKKILLIVAFLAAIGAGLYFYAYHGHRDIAAESADFTVSVTQLSDEFAADATSSTTKYADKTLLVSGKVTAVDASSKTITLDNVLTASFSQLPDVSEGSQVKMKARFVGYDDLLGEFRTDQASIPE